MPDETGPERVDVGAVDSENKPPTLGDLLDELDEYHDTLTDPQRRERIRDIIETAEDVEEPAVFGRTIVGFDRGDVAEGLLGSVLFGIPMMVEGGTQEVGAFISTQPLYLVGTVVFALAMAVGILYVADFQDVRIHRPILGVVPRRLASVVCVSAITAVVMSTAWGRVDWSDPALAVGTCTVAFVPMVIGAALGDILPG